MILSYIAYAIISTDKMSCTNVPIFLLFTPQNLVCRVRDEYLYKTMVWMYSTGVCHWPKVYNTGIETATTASIVFCNAIS